MLTNQQIKQWKEEGYVIIPDFFSNHEVEIMRNELERFRNEGIGRNPVTDGDGETTSQKNINYQVIPLNTISEAYRSLPYLPKVQEALAGLLGPNVIRILDQIFLKPAGNGAGTNWHTDNAYFKVKKSTEGTGMWIALHDANKENGTMRIIPKSHKDNYEHERDLGSDHHVTCAADVNEEDAVYVEVPAGGVIFFNFGIAHATGANKTDKDRAGCAYHFTTPNAIKSIGRGFSENGKTIMGSSEGLKFEEYTSQPDISIWEGPKLASV